MNLPRSSGRLCAERVRLDHGGPMSNLLKACIISQFQATHRMLDDCIRLCPEEHWDDQVAKYQFWLVAYHTLYCLDGHLEPREEDYKTDPRFHPNGMADIEGEYPSKRFS